LSSARTSITRFSSSLQRAQPMPMIWTFILSLLYPRQHVDAY
jgi:hypothetical protein